MFTWSRGIIKLCHSLNVGSSPAVNILFALFCMDASPSTKLHHFQSTIIVSHCFPSNGYPPMFTLVDDSKNITLIPYPPLSYLMIDFSGVNLSKKNPSDR